MFVENVLDGKIGAYEVWGGLESRRGREGRYIKPLIRDTSNYFYMRYDVIP